MSRAQVERAGFNLLEVSFASAILAVGIFGLVSAILSSNRLNEQSRESQLALHGAQTVAAEIQAYARGHTLDEVIGAYDGQTVAVKGLTEVEGASDVIRIDFILDETAVTPALDINNDGDTSDPAVPVTEVVIAPVRIRAQWSPPVGGDRTLEIVTTIFNPDGVTGGGGG
ncbi:MAG: hypothetical protein HY720_20595, partial [Planctomycetes bacterium]|nr:hypothetical protein [Planctomycetota bacterium]